MDSRYITSAAKPQQLESFGLPEVAFIGRSNSGKSSLLNALLQRKNLARTSATPGRTQMVNFFGLNNQIIFADLPGYGYNVASKGVEGKWDQLMGAYCQRDDIAAFLFLIDVRRDLQEFEVEFLHFLAEKAPVVFVMTKSDKLKQGERQKRIKLIKAFVKNQGIAPEMFIAISSLKKTGINELNSLINRICVPEETEEDSDS
jgi:GTP-binding protein